MSDEYPNIQYDPNPLLAPDIEVRPGMTFSVEALVGKEGFGECVKLEE